MEREAMERILTKYADIERDELLYKDETELRSMFEKVRRHLVVPETKKDLVPVRMKNL